MEVIIDETKTKRIFAGRFTIIELTTVNGIKGVGIARRSQGDKNVDSIGETIAQVRAFRAIEKKLSGRKINYVLEG